jgi:hypothetical protein
MAVVHRWDNLEKVSSGLACQVEDEFRRAALSQSATGIDFQNVKLAFMIYEIELQSFGE